MKQLLLFFLILPILSFSQCPPNGTFNSQAEIDAFAIDYPDCTEVSDLVISGDDITGLSGLNQITEIGLLSITGNPLLQTLDGLNTNIIINGNTFTGISITDNALLTDISALEFISEGNVIVEIDIWIEDNPSLNNLYGFPLNLGSLTSLYIENNNALTNLNGLEGVDAFDLLIIGNDNLIDFTGLGSFSARYFYIDDNSSLQSLNGMANPSNATFITIKDNQNLTDINGLDELGTTFFSFEHTLTITGNSNLSVCSTEYVCAKLAWATNFDSSWFSVSIQNNAPGCNNAIEIDYSCGVPSNDICFEVQTNGYGIHFVLNLGETIQANNEFATNSGWIPSCNDIPNKKDVWFQINSGDNTSLDIIAGAGYNIQLWEGDLCYDITHVSNGCGSGVLNDIPVVPDTYYGIQVWNDDTTDRGGSSWFDLTVQDGALSTQDFQLEAVKLFPNPVNDILNIQSNTPIENIDIFNLLGQKIKALNLGSNTNTIDMSHLSKGMYLIQVSMNGKQSTYKVLKK